ncbi:AAA family ATPase [Candidatus Parabeggiatoa sp. HSG14]|uniref:AAA family ATPase n=1 Tax=Candidatus Parabeggiatoa sp. HSG14 TaxID=3055593 RepID=UPI0025A8EFBA|nr:AAA family ATPase [Thiotrichales bacterium HSG14]
MKIKQITLQNYKRFIQPKTFSFTDSDGMVNEKTLIVGNNGTGKSSILQAIVILLASAIRDNFNPKNLDWAGFEYRHLQTGALPLKIEAEILFLDEEIKTTQKYAKQLKNMGVKLDREPASNKSVMISSNYDKRSRVFAKEGRNAYYQFKGYQYAKTLASFKNKKNRIFENIGNIYWYTEQRNSNNITNLLGSKINQLDDIRIFLANAYHYHTVVKNGERLIQEGEFDFYEKLESIYKKVFLGRSFVGSAPRFDIYEKAKAPDFFLYDGHHQYELAGMSAGERAVFPILMDFARWNINNSIIIIDELELHLHPPLQQTLVIGLSQIGCNNQFIFTSHSDRIISMFDETENQIIRLPNE